MAEEAQRDTNEPLADEDVTDRVVSMTEELSKRHDKKEPAHVKAEHERLSTFPDEEKFDPESDVAVSMLRQRRDSGSQVASERGKSAVDTFGMADTLNEGEAMLEEKKQIMGAGQRTGHQVQPDI